MNQITSIIPVREKLIYPDFSFRSKRRTDKKVDDVAGKIVKTKASTNLTFISRY